MTFSTRKNETSVPIPIPRTGIPGASGILLHILLVLTAAMIPFGLTVPLGQTAGEVVSVALLLLMAAYFMRSAKASGKASRGILPLMVLGSLFLLYAFQSMLPAAILFSLIFTVGEGSVLLATASSKQALWFPLVLIAAFGISFGLCRRVDIALLSLIPFPAAFALAFGTRSSAAKDTGLTRVGVICLTSLVLGATLLAAAAWFLYNLLGSLELSAIMEFINEFREALIQEFLSLEVASGNAVTTPFKEYEAEITYAVNSAFNSLPATLVVAVNVCAAVAQMITLSGLHAFGFGASVTDRVRLFRISAVSSGVFILAWITTLIANAETTTVVGTIAQNLITILLPGLALAGLLRLMQSMARKGGRMGCVIFLFLFIPCLALLAPVLLAIYEALSAVVGPLLAKLKPPSDDDPFGNNKKDGGDGDSGSDSDNSSNGPTLF